MTASWHVDAKLLTVSRMSKVDYIEIKCYQKNNNHNSAMHNTMSEVEYVFYINDILNTYFLLMFWIIYILYIF